MELLVTSLCAFTLVGSGGLLLILSLRGAQTSVLSHRIHHYVDQAVIGAKPQESLLLSRPRELSGTFRARILAPFFRGFTGILGSLTPAKTLRKLDEQLALAGNPLGMGPREFYGFQFAFMALGLLVVYGLLRNGLDGGGLRGSNTLMSAVAAALAVTICYYLPKSWLRARAGKRRESIAKGLPDALDMLSVCVEAGLGFDQSLQRVSEHWRTPLGAEFGRVVAEIGMGIPRRAALKNLVERVGSQEIASFVAVILQSDQLGMSIKDTLHAQAE
ncbi:MAG: type II secretion system F family protein, partial [Acidiferrobacterales bacterium]